ncbi:MAG: hypothetical protein H0U66_04820 [Gemmatimonadaceae bacterium]|nr:hypothetical protein [Gemmatimonadaceae bacterium]
MSRPTVILLPGLHGTANLFQRFVDAAPRDVSPRIQSLPNDAPLDYEQLAEWVVARLPSEAVVLIAESFSGPLALFAAARAPNIAGIVLCGTFVTAPAPPILAKLPKVVFAVTPPVAAISALLTAGDWTLAREVQTTVRTIPADVITSRVVSALHVDARAELESFTKPLLCISAKRDWIVPARSTAVIRALKPSAEFVEIDGPHMLLQTRSRETWQVVSAFLDRVQGNHHAPHNLTSST